ncbi:MAG: hypothetical protein MUF48_04255 [Pirellulaceae bacterium]|nr:hypothetical protein [Pirellulaceae bacterium]
MLATNMQDVGPAGASSRRAPYPLAAAGVPFEKCLVQDLDEPRLVRQFEQLAQSVLRELPPETGGSLLLAGVGSSSHVADVAAHVARRLALHGRASLLIDADASQRVLTQRFAATGEKGLVETLLESAPASRYVLATSVPQLAFLAFGQGRLARRAASADLMRTAVAQWRRDYRYTVIAGGVEASASLGALARQCDATYLVVQLGVADRQQTTLAAQTLMAAGARLLGSVATGVADVSAVAH